MPSSIRKNAPFRAMILTCMFLVVSNSLLSYYTLYAIRVFSATESQIAALAALAVISGAVGHVGFGVVVDHWGPKATSVIGAILVACAGAIALTTHTINFLFAAWVLANLGNSGYGFSWSLLIGEVCPPGKLPLYVGVHTTISLALSSAVLLLLAPTLESIGFTVLFTTVLFCGLFSLLINVFVLRKQLARLSV
jgi:MFS family permease